MALIDELATTSRAKPGPVCAVQQVRADEGEDVFTEIMEVLLADGYTADQKREVLARHGYEWHRQLIARHSRHRLSIGNGCVRCASWLGVSDD